MSQLVEYRNGMAYGSGIDSLDGRILGDAVEKAEPEEIKETGGQSIAFKMRLIESVSSLREEMGMSMSVDASWGLFNAGAKMSFAQESRINSYSIYVMIHVSVLNSFKQLRYVNLRPVAFDLLKQGEHKFFKQKYGNKFVRGINTGGEFVGLLEIKTSSQQEKQDFKSKAKLNMDSIGSSVDVKAAFSHGVSRGAQNKNIEVHSFQRGGSDTEVPDTVEEMIDRATTFPNNVSKKSVAYSAQLIDYLTTDNYPPGLSPLELTIAKDVLNYLLREREKIKMLKNDVDYILGNADEFKNFSYSEFREHSKALMDLLNEINRAAVHCTHNPTESSYPSLVIPGIILPERLEKKIFVGFTNFPTKKNKGSEFQITLAEQKPKNPPRESYQETRTIRKDGRLVNESYTKYLNGEWKSFDWNNFENYVKQTVQENNSNGAVINCKMFFNE